MATDAPQSTPRHTVATSAPVTPSGSGPSGGPSGQGGKRLLSTEMDERRSKGLCFWCDNKFTPEHRCLERRQSYTLEFVSDGIEEDDMGGDTPHIEDLTLTEEQEEEATPHVSVHTLDGTTPFKRCGSRHRTKVNQSMY
ncbi:hypothetical protein KSP39_PZI021331 [Platanthera zijinensis]|uniref:Uncharacterized protein n=1 Tax=Platanthera zijinensis TaxID=2320716 RepID=A0AAP0AY71_9ASPA